MAREYFDGFLDWLDEDQVDPYWGALQVPYVPFYAYEEVLATFGDAAFQKGTVLSAVESLAQWITDGSVTSLGKIEEQLRLETLQRFARQPKSSRVPGTRSIFYVSYARQDYDDQMTRLFRDLNNAIRSRPRAREPVTGREISVSGEGARAGVSITGIPTADKSLNQSFDCHFVSILHSDLRISLRG